LITGTDKESVVSLLVCDTSQSSTVDVYLNDFLIEKGLAIHVCDETTAVELKKIRAKITQTAEEQVEGAAYEMRVRHRKFTASLMLPITTSLGM